MGLRSNLLRGNVFVVVKRQDAGYRGVTLPGDAPTSRSWDSGDESVYVEPFEQARDMCGLPTSKAWVLGLREEAFTDITITEAHEGVFATRDRREQVEVAFVGGVEAAIATICLRDRSGQVV